MNYTRGNYDDEGTGVTRRRIGESDGPAPLGSRSARVAERMGYDQQDSVAPMAQGFAASSDAEGVMVEAGEGTNKAMGQLMNSSLESQGNYLTGMQQMGRYNQEEIRRVQNANSQNAAANKKKGGGLIGAIGGIAGSLIGGPIGGIIGGAASLFG